MQLLVFLAFCAFGQSVKFKHIFQNRVMCWACGIVCFLVFELTKQYKPSSSSHCTVATRPGVSVARWLGGTVGWYLAVKTFHGPVTGRF